MTNCETCEKRNNCKSLCEAVESLIPSMESGRVDDEDIRKLMTGRIETAIILDYSDTLTEKQKTIVQLYYREGLNQKAIAEALNTTQQAVSDSLKRARASIGKVAS